jgi:hypothetical protein
MTRAYVPPRKCTVSVLICFHLAIYNTGIL